MTTQQAQGGMAVIQFLTAALIGADDPTYISHCIGIETGLRLAFRHPEYARLLLRRVDEEMTEGGVDRGRLSADWAIDALIRTHPLEDSS